MKENIDLMLAWFSFVISNQGLFDAWSVALEDAAAACLGTEADAERATSPPVDICFIFYVVLPAADWIVYWPTVGTYKAFAGSSYRVGSAEAEASLLRTTTVFAYLALLDDWAANFSITGSFAFLAFSRIRRFLRLRPSTFIFSLIKPRLVEPATWKATIMCLLPFLRAKSSWLRLFSISMARRSGERKRNHWSDCGSKPT